MRKLRWIVPVVVAVLIVLAGGVYGIYWYATKQNLDQIVSNAKTRGVDIRYGSVYVNPFKSTVGANDLVILRDDGSRVEIGAMRMQSDVGFLWNGEEQLKKGQWPDTLTLHFQRVKSDLPSYDALSASAGDIAADPALPEHNPMFCGDTNLLDLKALGYTEMNSDLTLTFHWQPNQQSFLLKLDDKLVNMLSFRTAMTIKVNQAHVTPQNVLAANPRIESVRFELQDEGLVSRVSNVCAGSYNMKPAEFRAMFKKSIADMQEGVKLPESLAAIVKKVVDPGVHYTLDMHPAGGIGLDLMYMRQQPEQMLSYLDPILDVNGRKIELAKIDWRWVERLREQKAEMQRQKMALEQAPEAPLPDELDSSSETKGMAQTPADENTTTDKAPSTDALVKLDQVGTSSDGSVIDMDAYRKQMLKELERSKPRPDPKFSEVDKTELDKYLNHDVKILTDFGYRVDGRLLSVTDGVVRVRQRVDKGTAIYPLLVSQISYIEVFH